MHMEEEPLLSPSQLLPLLPALRQLAGDALCVPHTWVSALLRVQGCASQGWRHSESLPKSVTWPSSSPALIVVWFLIIVFVRFENSPPYSYLPSFLLSFLSFFPFFFPFFSPFFLFLLSFLSLFLSFFLSPSFLLYHFFSFSFFSSLFLLPSLLRGWAPLPPLGRRVRAPRIPPVYVRA